MYPLGQLNEIVIAPDVKFLWVLYKWKYIGLYLTYVCLRQTFCKHRLKLLNDYIHAIELPYTSL